MEIETESKIRKAVIILLVIASFFVAIFFVWSQLSINQANKAESVAIVLRHQYNTIKLGGFCGASSYEKCETDDDCAVGCHNECGSLEISGFMCPVQFDSNKCIKEENYNVECGCKSGKCQWGRIP